MGTPKVWVAVHLDRFVPRDDAKRRRGGSPLAVNEIADQVRNDGKRRGCVVKNESENNGHRVRECQRPTGVGALARPKRGGAVAQGTTKRLTFREGRLRLTLQKSLPDLKVRRLGGRALGRWFWP